MTGPLDIRGLKRTEPAILPDISFQGKFSIRAPEGSIRSRPRLDHIVIKTATRHPESARKVPYYNLLCSANFPV
jgi:hypothetical protein